MTWIREPDYELSEREAQYGADKAEEKEQQQRDRAFDEAEADDLRLMAWRRRRAES